MVDQDDGDLVVALELAQAPEEQADVRRGVLVALMQADEGVEDDQSWLDVVERQREALLVLTRVEAEHGGRDEADGEPIEGVDAAGRGDLGGALLDGRGAVLGGVEQDGASAADGETPEAGLAAGDGDGELESEPGLSRLCRVPDHAV